MNKKLGVYHFWTMFVFFNLTFSRCSSLDCWPAGRVFTYAKNSQTLNDFSSVSASCSVPRFDLRGEHCVVGRSSAHKSRPTSVDSLGWSGRPLLRFLRTDFRADSGIMSDPYHYSEVDAPCGGLRYGRAGTDTGAQQYGASLDGRISRDHDD